MANKLLHTKAEVLRENISQTEEGVIDAVVGSSNVLDRMGDVISQDGWNLTNYSKNPVILWGHNVREERPPIGKALKVWLEGKQQRTKKLMFKVKFDLQDSFAAEIFRKIKDGFINTVSVGFLPSEWEELEPDNPWGGRKYTKQELLELSFVPVPANPEAVVALRSLSQDDKRFEPVELKDAFPEIAKEDLPQKEEDKEEEVLMPEKEEPKKEGEETTPANPEPPKEEAPVTPEPPKEEGEKKEETPVVTPEPPKEEKPEDKPVVETPVEEKPVEEKPAEEKAVELSEEEQDALIKSAIPFKDLGTAPETEGWDGPGEIAKCDTAGLKAICTWFDSDNSDNKSAYKLPHHKGDEGHKAVWRGVTAAMAALLGARGGTDIPEADRKAVYNHLKKHYKQFDKEAPDFKMVEDQVLAKLDDEVQSLALDREEKYQVRLIKKVLENQKDSKAKAPSQEHVKQALEMINLALSLYKSNSLKGGESLKVKS